MNLFDLERQSEELEQTLHKQLQLVKNDSGIFLKIAGIALVSGLATTAAYRLTRSGSEAKRKKKKKAKKQSYSFWGNLRSRLFWLALDVGKQALIRNVQERLEAEKANEE
jgi:hypothetical protein